MIEKRAIIRFTLFVLIYSTSFAQGPAPSHTRVIFSHLLTSESTTESGSLKNINGTFTAGGWQAGPAGKKDCSLRLTLNDFLPAVGTVEITVKNFEPYTQSSAPKHHILALTSQDSVADQIFYNGGSWCYLRFGQYFNTAPDKAGIKFDTGSTGKAERYEPYILMDKVWDIDASYTFKIVWSQEYIWLLINGTVVHSQPFRGQIQRFRYIFIGDDDNYPTMFGPIYSNLKIYTEDTFAIFADKTTSSQLSGTAQYGGYGLTTADFNNDGLLDFYLGNRRTEKCLSDILFIQKTGGVFADEAPARGLEDRCGSYAVVAADVDNDGDLDIFNANHEAPNQLYINNGSGTFTNESEIRGIEKITATTVGAIALDIDNDGDLDLFAVNHGVPNEMYINDGTGRFQRQDRGTNGGTEDTNLYLRQGVTAADVDNDGDIDIYVCRFQRSSAATPNYLYINNGKGQFTEEAQTRGVAMDGRSNGATFADLDTDGDMDLFVSNSQMEGKQQILGVFINNGNGSFTDRSTQFNIPNDGLSPVLFDVDNDGDLDLYLIQSNAKTITNSHSLYLNAGGVFTSAGHCGADVVAARARGSTLSDGDKDGDLDLYLACEEGYNIFLVNQTQTAHNYIQVITVGPRGDLGAYGARIDVYVSGHLGQSGYLLGHREMVSNYGYLCQDMPYAHFGLKTQTSCDIRITYSDGSVLERTNLAANQRVRLTAPYQMVLVEGDGQTASPGEQLPRPLVVKVTDFNGVGLGGIPVSYSVVQGTGTLIESQPRLTDTNGLTSVNFKLGPLTPEYAVEARCAEVQMGSPVRFKIYASGSAPAKLEKISGDNQKGVTTFPLKDSIIVRVVNGYNSGVANFPVQFEISQGGGKLNNSSTKLELLTKGNGYAAVQWSLGAVQGNNNLLQVSCFNASAHLSGSPQVFHATGTSHTAIFLTPVSGDRQTGTVNTRLAKPVVIEVRNAFQQLKPNSPVMFKIIQGDGRVNDGASALVNSDANGLVSAFWNLGTVAGENKLKANSIEDTTAVLMVTALAEPGPAKNLSAAGATQFTGIVGRQLTRPFSVNITDEFGNAVPNHPIRFHVILGGGQIEGLDEKQVNSDASGLASVYFTPGPQVGQNTVAATSEGLTGASVSFNVHALAGNAAGIFKFSGDDQAGMMGATLPAPMVVRVTDSFNNPISRHPVRFEITAGGGNLSRTQLQDRLTDTTGLASVYLTLGSVRGDNFVRATSSFNGVSLIGSPTIFRAFAKTEPRALIRLAGDNQIGIISQPLFDSLKVRVLDADNLPVPGQPVQFRVIMGGGNFNGLAEFSTSSDWNGIAGAVPVLGAQVGRDRHKFEVRSFNAIGQQLQHSPVDFTASARTSPAHEMLVVGGSGQAGRSLAPLPLPLQVLVRDLHGQPVAGHNVLFMVTKGGGSLDGIGKRELIKMTDASGIAEVTLTLGSTIGDSNHVVRAQSDDGLQALINSPLSFYASATSGAIDLLASSLSASSPILADGVSQSQILVKLVDKNGNPIRNVTVSVTATGSNNHLQQLTSQTDANGTIVGQLASSKSEKKVVHAHLPEDGITLPDSAIVDFIAGKPTSMRMVSGNQQTANIGTALLRPLVVELRDVFGNPVPDYPVEYIALSGDSRILTRTPISTDARGQAIAEAVVSSVPGVNYFEVVVPGLGSLPARFEVTAVSHPPSRLTLSSGNQQMACIGRQFENPLVVTVTDAQNLPVWNIPITFQVEVGGCVLVGANPDTTDLYGQASIAVQAGTIDQGHVVKAFVVGNPAVTRFILTTIACGAMSIEVVSGNNQEAEVNSELPQPVIVRVSNENRVPMENIFVTFRAETPGAMVLTPQPDTTDANGIASARLKLGPKSGAYSYYAGITGQDTRVVITASARRPIFQKIELFSGNNQPGFPSTVLSEPIAVRITDQDGRAVKNQAVAFAVTQGGGAITQSTPVYSDSQGIAQVYWRLGAAGSQRAHARADGLIGSPVEFQASLSDNRPPEIHAPVDTIISEMQETAFKVRGIDPDGDPVYFGAYNLPDGARFDSTGYQYFVWKPGYTQAGDYLIRFYARDNKGLRRYAHCLIHVLNLNRPPQIVSYIPANDLVQANYGAPLNFKMTAMDPDADHLNYSWQINKLIVGNQASFIFIPNPSLPINVTVTGMVFDQQDTVSRRWNVMMATSVELAVFEARPQGSEGVWLYWQTRRENEHQGFHVLRSYSENGIYARINREIIPAHQKGSYGFRDHTVQAGTEYFYKLVEVSINGHQIEHGPISVRMESPQEITLYQNYPNPFNPTTTIRFQLPQSTFVRLEIFNLAGQLIRSLFVGEMAEGYHSCLWDGRDNLGNLMPSAIYYYRFQAGSYIQIRRLLLLK